MFLSLIKDGKSESASSSKRPMESNSDSEEKSNKRQQFQTVHRRETRPQHYRLEWEKTFQG